jgi:RNA polymerase sigma-70 factor (ECF subfamily)
MHLSVKTRSIPTGQARSGDAPHLTLLAAPAERGAGGLSGHRLPAGVGPGLAFRDVYERWFDDIVKWLYALGVPGSDTEDLAQEIFLVVRRRLSQFTGGNLAGWLYRITQLTVRDHRRRAWFKNLVSRRREIDLAQLPTTGETPERSLERREHRRILQELLAKMSEKRRATFVLFEIEGYSGEEISLIQDVPLGTVWTRLHHARKDFWKLVADHARAERRRR